MTASGFGANAFGRAARPRSGIGSTQTSATDWVELRRVNDYLAGQELKDGELTCFESRTISLYLEMDLEPPTCALYLDIAVRVSAGTETNCVMTWPPAGSGSS